MNRACSAPSERLEVTRAVTRLLNGRGIRLYVVYVKDFGGVRPLRWAENALRTNGLADTAAILAVATDETAFWFGAPGPATAGKVIDVEIIRRDRIKPAVDRHEWARAAIEAANGLDAAG